MSVALKFDAIRSPAQTREAWGGWKLIEREAVSSTNDEASQWPPWTAVRADRQTAGRGRYQRAWVSDDGGLWLSAVVPIGPLNQGWLALPLAVGAVACEVFASLGARELRLRWPNDIMAGDAKLAGILIDQFQPGRAVVGLGVNVHNRPETQDPSLSGSVVRLSELIENVPSLSELAGLLLCGLRELIREMQETGFAPQVPRINRWWENEAVLEVETEHGGLEAIFAGVDSAGRLLLRPVTGGALELEPHQVQRLRELKRGKR